MREQPSQKDSVEKSSSPDHPSVEKTFSEFTEDDPEGADELLELLAEFREHIESRALSC